MTRDTPEPTVSMDAFGLWTMPKREFILRAIRDWGWIMREYQLSPTGDFVTGALYTYAYENGVTDDDIAEDTANE